MEHNEEFEDVILPVYVINLPERSDRLTHIKKQFEDKVEFELTILEAVKHEIGAVGLWKSILSVVELAVSRDEDVIIICEDDHEFTSEYSKGFLIRNLIDAYNQGANVLSGGIGGFHHLVPLTDQRCWIDSFWCTQFMVIYSRFFQAILDEPFVDTDTADGKISEMTSAKMVLYPFISVQKDFGYSDVTKSNDLIKGNIIHHFENTKEKMNKIMDVHHKYKRMSSHFNLEL